MKVEIMTPGLQALESRLHGLGVAAATRIADTALLAGAQPVHSAVLSRAPVKTGTLKKYLAIMNPRRYRYGGRVISIGYGSRGSAQLIRETKAQVRHPRTGELTSGRSFYPVSVEYGHDKPFASLRRLAAGVKHPRRSRSQSILLTAGETSAMTQRMRDYRMKLSARGQAANAAINSTKKIPPHPFMRPAFDASAPAAASAIERSLTTQIDAAWSARLAATGKAAG